ncbi:hypothetical protein AGMMS50268_16930 [Spirochaetia bacterium]|nr:hypothetical protein AGMMS50268_16930 [Spirochaetia bacterium]
MSLIYHPDNASFSDPRQEEGEDILCEGCGEPITAWNESPQTGICEDCYEEDEGE